MLDLNKVFLESFGISSHSSDNGFTKERIYEYAGKEDRVMTAYFVKDSESYNNFGKCVTGEAQYTEKERIEIEKAIEQNLNGTYGYIKLKHLVGKQSVEQKELLLSQGFNSKDIYQLDVAPLLTPENTYHSKENRKIKTLEIPIEPDTAINELNFMFESLLHFVNDGMKLTPQENSDFLALKLVLYPYSLTEAEKQIVFDKEGKIHNNDVIRSYLLFKFKLGKYKPDYVEAQRNLNCIDLSNKINSLDYLLKRMGSSIKKILDTKNKIGFHIIDKTLSFKEIRLNSIGKYPIYLDFNGYLHICLRHVREWQINDFFKLKTEFQLNENDLLPTLRKVVDNVNDDYQSRKNKDENLVYRIFGRNSVYVNGDYYSLKIEESGNVVNFNKDNYTQNPTK